MKTCLITGVAGFVGSHLAEFLLGRGDRVVGVDNLSGGSLSNLRNVIDLPSFDLYEKDVRDLTFDDQLLADVDEVYHLAATVGVDVVTSAPIETIRNNIDSTMHALDVASTVGCRIFIASSSEVYGPKCHSVHGEEDDLQIGPTSIPRWSYAYSKAACECIAFSFLDSTGVEVVIGRLFNVVGPRQSLRTGSVLPVFINQAIEGRAVTVHGDGSQTRCFTDVRDVVELIAALMNSDSSVGEIVNIGSLQEMTIRELAEKVVSVTGSGSAVNTVGDTDRFDFRGHIEKRVPDLRKLKSLMGEWKYRPIEESITGMSDWVAAGHRNRGAG